jgi:hypothetical protein
LSKTYAGVYPVSDVALTGAAPSHGFRRP